MTNYECPHFLENRVTKDHAGIHITLNGEESNYLINRRTGVITCDGAPQTLRSITNLLYRVVETATLEFSEASETAFAELLSTPCDVTNDIWEKGLHKTESIILFGPISEHEVDDLIAFADGSPHKITKVEKAGDDYTHVHYSGERVDASKNGAPNAVPNVDFTALLDPLTDSTWTNAVHNTLPMLLGRPLSTPLFNRGDLIEKVTLEYTTTQLRTPISITTEYVLTMGDVIPQDNGQLHYHIDVTLKGTKLSDTDAVKFLQNHYCNDEI